MKILVVEDSQAKLKNILSVIYSSGKVDERDVSIARSGVDARRYLEGDHFDLMVLDIALPDRADKDPDPSAGFHLLSEISTRKKFSPPSFIVGLTAHEDIWSTGLSRFQDEAWWLIRYESSDTAWENSLLKRIEHIHLVLKSSEFHLPTYGVDLAIITALEDPELTQVLRLPCGWEMAEVPGDPQPYWRGKYTDIKGEARSVVACSCPRMGGASAAITATKIINAFRPRYLAMAGICAGIQGKCNLGDVIAADPCWDWQSGKWEAVGGKSCFAIAPHQVALDSAVRWRISQLSRNEAIMMEIAKSWSGQRPHGLPRIHIGPVASGSAVLADQLQIDKIQEQHRKVVGVEMEIYGFYAAGEAATIPAPQTFAMKGVCDFGDAHKNDGVQVYASHVSARAIFELASKYL